MAEENDVIVEGVTIGWLSRCFGISAESVRNHLAGAPAIRVKGRNKYYSIATAAQYLVKPVLTEEQILAKMKSTELPERLRKDVWAAQIARQKYELEAKELWQTEDVIEVLATLFTSLKTTIQSWPQTVKQTKGLNESQRQLLIDLGDRLQDDMYNSIEDLCKENSNPSYFDIIDEQLSPSDLDDIL